MVRNCEGIYRDTYWELFSLMFIAMFAFSLISDISKNFSINVKLRDPDHFHIFLKLNLNELVRKYINENTKVKQNRSLAEENLLKNFFFKQQQQQQQKVRKMTNQQQNEDKKHLLDTPMCSEKKNCF